MKLPNGERAIVPIEKLRDYSLSPTHPVGQHKARVLAAVFGWTQADAEHVQALVQEHARTGSATLGLSDPYGLRYTIDVVLPARAGTATLRSCWIIRTGEAVPCLTSLYVL